tara:strand:- start:650 stop:1369 length:720 start_codon:yes stop_codon:yes gene_type:complete
MENFWEESVPPGYYDSVVKHGLKKNRGIQACWHHITFSTVGNLIKESKNHLDYACGPGTFIGNYANTKSTGIDISSNQINYANSNYSSEGDFLTLNNFAIENYEGKFDYITVLGLFEYLENNEILSLLQNFDLLINQNGKIIITTPNYGGIMYFLDKILNYFGPVDYNSENINKFTKKRLLKLIRDTNKWNIKITKYNTPFMFLSFFSIKLGFQLNKLIERLTKNKIGFLLLIELTKND